MLCVLVLAFELDPASLVERVPEPRQLLGAAACRTDGGIAKGASGTGPEAPGTARPGLRRRRSPQAAAAKFANFGPLFPPPAVGPGIVDALGLEPVG